MSESASSGSPVEDPYVPDGVISIAARRDQHVWEWCGYVNVLLGDSVVSGYLDVVEPTGDGFSARLTADANVLAQVRSHLTPFTMVPAASVNAGWRLEGVETTGDDAFDVMPIVRLRIPVDSVPIGHPGTDHLHRLIYTQVSLPQYRRQVWRGDGAGAHAQFFNAFSVFGRTFAITQVHESSTDPNDVAMSLSYSGERISELELDALDMAMYLMCGRGGRRAVEEVYDRDGRFRSRTYDYGTFSFARHPEPIFPSNRYSNETSSQSWMPALVEACAKAFAANIPLRAILFHYFSSQIHNPEIALLFLGVAREAMLPKASEISATMLDHSEFIDRMAPVKELVRVQLADQNEREVDSVLRRIDGLNQVSVSRRRALMIERTGIAPDAEERRVLFHRDDVTHAGYILETSYDEEELIRAGALPLPPYAERLKDLTRDEKTFRHYVLRTLLRLIGYVGPYVDPRDRSLRELGTGP